MKVLGLNLSHDRSAALVQDGKVLVAIAEERLDRIKHSMGYLYKNREEIGPKVLPWRSISYCLQEAKVGLDDLDAVVVDHAGLPVDLSWVRAQLPLKNPERLHCLPCPSHHLAHAYSAFYASSFEESAILVVDHIGSYVPGKGKESESIFIGGAGGIRNIFRHYATGRDLEEGSESLANFYRLTTILLGFINPQIDFGQKGKWLAMYDDAGKTMGLAPYGKPREDWGDWVAEGPEGFPKYTSWAKWLREKGFLETGRILTHDTKMELKLLLPEIRKPTEPIQSRHKDLAFKAQQELEKGILLLANKAYRETKAKNLCLAGGVALNSVANARLKRESSFKNIFIQPAATDDGNALGAAYYGYFNLLKGSRRVSFKNVYLGREYSEQAILTALRDHSLHLQKKYNDFEKLCTVVAAALSRGKVVGWFQGGSEFGPRALGHRSILADPRDPKMKDYLNDRIKFREAFRPYAPAVLAGQVSEHFELDGESPYMLLVAKVRKETLGKVPAITHVDGTARLQTVSRDTSPKFFSLIESFYRETGMPMVLNTSFNIKGQPIVETPGDAIECFLGSELDFLVLGNHLIAKNLYDEDVLRHLIPVSRVRPERDLNDPERFFLSDPKSQNLFSLSQRQFNILSHAGGERDLEKLSDLLQVAFSEFAGEIRTLLRKGWLTLLLPNQKVVKGGKD